MNRILKSTLCIGTAIFVCSFSGANKRNIKEKYASYRKGDVYIVGEAPIEFTDNPLDVFVIDRRDRKNPDMRVYDSFRVTSLEDQEEIIDILLRYEKENESAWDRTKRSLQNEWIVHNFLYGLGIETDRTRHVDFDNNDEETYKTLKLWKHK